MIDSQGGISQNATLELRFDLILEKPALVSGEIGFQSYPIVVRAEKNEQGFVHGFYISIPYSSTCPCSASLSRQLYARAIEQSFPGTTINKADVMEWAQSQIGSVATPHSQRSFAYLSITIDDGEWPDLSALIQDMEAVIGTPVQTAVKRSDEHEFARLNATNLMFCEDAARRLKKHLEGMSLIKDFWLKVEHRESLHAHNAVAVAKKSKPQK